MRKPENAGFTASFDMLGEAARTFPDAERYYQSYEDAIRAVGKVGAARAIRSRSSCRRCTRATRSRNMTAACRLADRAGRGAGDAGGKDVGIAFTIDAEETERLEMSLDIIEAVAGLPALKGWDGLGMAIQAYGKRARPTIAWAERARRRRPAGGSRRGWSRAPIGTARSSARRKQGLSDYPLFTRKAATDVSYLACARDMLAAEAHLSRPSPPTTR